MLLGSLLLTVSVCRGEEKELALNRFYQAV